MNQMEYRVRNLEKKLEEMARIVNQLREQIKQEKEAKGDK